jgi:hypothetical protein
MPGSVTDPKQLSRPSGTTSIAYFYRTSSARSQEVITMPQTGVFFYLLLSCHIAGLELQDSFDSQIHPKQRDVWKENRFFVRR